MTLTATVVTGLTLLQDAGRPGYQHLGVPASGPWHAVRYRQLADLLEVDEPVAFEVLTGALHLTATGNVLVAVVGPAQVKVNTTDLAPGSTLLLADGETLCVKPDGPGPVYVGAAGLTSEQVLGSSSTDTLSGVGPGPVTAGQRFITACETSNPGRFISRVERRESILRYIPGPHGTAEPRRSSHKVLSTARTGTRLSAGETAVQGVSGSLPSLPTVPGVIQLPPDGQPIILGPDSGVTGGYPVLGVIITADLPHLAELTPGQAVTLVPVALDIAVTAMQIHERALGRSVASVQQLT